MQHGGVESRADNGCVRRTLAAALAPFVLQERRNFALGHSWLDGANRRELRGNRSVYRFTRQLNFAIIFDHAQRGQQRPNVRVPCAHRKGVRRLQPRQRLGGV